MSDGESGRTMNSHCPLCGAPLTAGALEGLCPACLLQQGASAETATQGGPKPFQPPGVEEVARMFPQLEIIAFIGKGGMGAVYKARQPALDRLVALKILPPQAAGDPGFAERFVREARALAKLNHPNIVAVYEFGQVNGLPFLLMEFVDGLNLRELERSGRLSSREALKIVPQICEALQFAHDEGVVHRDIKPENILLDKKGRVKIADFGIAKIMGADTAPIPASSRPPSAGGPQPSITEAGKIIGTPHYMAPEQVEKPQSVDHRADIFSLGVVFYEMLTGELPLGRFAPPSSRIRGVTVDVRLDEVVLRALEKEPERRYQQASQVKTAVETIAGEAGRPPPAFDARPGGDPASPKGPARSPLAVALGVVFALAGLGVVILWWNKAGPVESNLPSPANLVGFWEAEGNANDSSIQGNDGTFRGGPTYAAGKVGSAFDFNNDNTYVDVPDSPSLNPTNALTVTAWIYPTQSPENLGAPIIKKAGNNTWNEYGYTMEYDTAGDLAVRFGVYTDGGWMLSTDTSPTPLNTWTFLAGVYDGTNISMYMNGILMGTTPTTGHIMSSPLDLQIGHDPNRVDNVVTPRFFSGLIDQAGLYNTALTGGQIKALYQLGSTGQRQQLNIVRRDKTPRPPALVFRKADSSVDAVGTPSMTYQWVANGANVLTSETDPMLVLNKVEADALGNRYSVVVGNKLGAAFHFDGATGYISIPASPSLNVGNGGSFTIEGWVDPVDVSTPGPLWEWNNGAGNLGTHFWINVPVAGLGGAGPGSVFANVVDLGGMGHSITSPANLIVAGEFNHVAVAYDEAGGVVKLFLNGNEVAIQNIGSFTPNTTYGVFLGTRATTPYFFKGLMDEMTLHNTALSADQIQAIYNAGRRGKSPGAPAIISQPRDQRVYAGRKAVFSVDAVGTPPLSYQWVMNGSNVLTAETNPVLALNKLEASLAGERYSVVVRNEFGEASSAGATLTVIKPVLPSTNDLWDISRGTVITGDSGVHAPFSDIRDMFGGNFSQLEPGNTVFDDGRPEGFVHYVEWQTPRPVTIGSFALFAAGDPKGYNYAREFSRFVLKAKSSARAEDYDLTLYTLDVTNHPYSPADPINEALVVTNITPVTAQYFRAEFTQHNAGPGYDGPRVIELDGFGPPMSPPSGLVAWWAAEGDANDSVGTNDGVLMNGAGFGAGEVGQAFSLSGANQYVMVPGSSSLNVGAGDGFTVDCWINPADVSLPQPVFEWDSDPDSDTGIGVHLWISTPISSPAGGPGCLFSNLKNSDYNFILYTGGGLVTNGGFQHVALSYDKASGMARLYYNGALVAENRSPTSNFTPGTTTEFDIGKRVCNVHNVSGPAGRVFTGLIDELQIYNRALSGGEIRAIYDAGSAGTGPPRAQSGVATR